MIRWATVLCRTPWQDTSETYPLDAFGRTRSRHSASAPRGTAPRSRVPDAYARSERGSYVIGRERVLPPVLRGISKRVCRHTSQSCCPWNVRFATELRQDAFRPREVLAGKDARQLARELLQITQEEFSRAFKSSPMKRAKLRGLKRNAAVVLGNIGDTTDVPVLTTALRDDEPLVTQHATWALSRIRERAR